MHECVLNVVALMVPVEQYLRSLGTGCVRRGEGAEQSLLLIGQNTEQRMKLCHYMTFRRVGQSDSGRCTSLYLVINSALAV